MNRILFTPIFLILIAASQLQAQNSLIGKEEPYLTPTKTSSTQAGGFVVRKNYFLIRETEAYYCYLMNAYGYVGANGINNAIIEIYSKTDLKKTKSIPVYAPAGEYFFDAWGNNAKMVLFTKRPYALSGKDIKMYEVNISGKLTLLENFTNPEGDKTDNHYELVWSQDKKTFAVYNIIFNNTEMPAQWNMYVKVYDRTLRMINSKTIPLTFKTGTTHGDYYPNFINSSERFIIKASVSNDGAFGCIWDDGGSLNFTGITKAGDIYLQPISNIAPLNYLKFAVSFNAANEFNVVCLTAYYYTHEKFKTEEVNKTKMIYYWRLNEQGLLTKETKIKVTESAPEVNKNYLLNPAVTNIHLYCCDTANFIIGERIKTGVTTDNYGIIFCVSTNNNGEVNWARSIAKNQKDKKVADPNLNTPFAGYNFYVYQNSVYFIYTDITVNKFNSEAPLETKGVKSSNLFLTSLNADGDLKQEGIFNYEALNIPFAPGQSVIDGEGYAICPFVGPNGSALGKFKLK